METTPGTQLTAGHRREQQLCSRFVTVVYRITDEDAWRGTNPLQYEHHGLSAVTAGIGDAFERLDEAESLLKRCDVEPGVMASSLRRAIQRYLDGENAQAMASADKKTTPKETTL